MAQDGSGDFNGKDDKPIRAAIKKAGEGEGTIFIKPGEYLIRNEINLRSGITVKGFPETVLKLPSPVLTTAEGGKGEKFLMVSDTSELAPDTYVQICPPVEIKTFPDGDKEAFTAKIKKVKEGKILLAEPLPYTVQEKSRAGYANNIFYIGGSEENITIENLGIFGGRKEDIPMPGHVKRCAILASGGYSYGGGPTAPPIKNFHVMNCYIRNCYGRAVAMYSVAHGKVSGCKISNIADEAIDFDHFCFYCRAVGNEIKSGVTGVTINDGSYCTVEYNSITDCGVGITIWWWYKCPQKNIDIENKIRHNFIYSPKKAGISIGKRCFWNEVVGNFVSGGIKVVEPSNVVENNTLR